MTDDHHGNLLAGAICSLINSATEFLEIFDQRARATNLALRRNRRAVPDDGTLSGVCVACGYRIEGQAYTVRVQHSTRPTQEWMRISRAPKKATRTMHQQCATYWIKGKLIYLEADDLPAAIRDRRAVMRAALEALEHAKKAAKLAEYDLQHEVWLHYQRHRTPVYVNNLLVISGGAAVPSRPSMSVREEAALWTRDRLAQSRGLDAKEILDRIRAEADDSGDGPEPDGGGTAS